MQMMSMRLRMAAANSLLREANGGMNGLKLVSLAVGLGAIASGAIADGAPAGDIEAGRAMAQQLCARCHAIAGPGPSPLAQAPLFSRFGRQFRVDDLAEAMAEGLVVGHGPMPEFVFEPEEIDDLLAYLNSVQE